MELLEGIVRIDDLDEFLSTIDEVADHHEATVQAFDARYVAGRAHLGRAVELAERAIDRGDTVARDPAVEILCYAAGRRQIERALEMGVSEGERAVVVLATGGDEAGAIVALADRLDIEERDVLAEPDEERLTAFFEITDAERAATDASLEELVCERVALLVVEK